MALKVKTEVISNYRKENELTVEQFCKKCHISKRTYYRFIHSELNLSIAVLIKITRLLNILCEDILEIVD